jgi:ABC-2 type transport system ATP-binding protein
MQQRLALAVALVHEPRVLLLDEPTLGLDLDAQEAFRRDVLRTAAEGCAVLLSTHQLEVAERLAIRVAILNCGHVVAEDGTAELLRRFAPEGWQVAFEGELDEARQARLRKLGAEVGSGLVAWAGPAEGLYEILEALRPAPIVRVERGRAGLTEVFRRLTREAGRA